MGSMFNTGNEGVSAWSLNGAVISISLPKGAGSGPESTAADLPALSININYRRGVDQFKPLTGGKRIIVVGVPEGVMSISSLVGSTDAVKRFLEFMSDPCTIADHVITVSPLSTEICDNGATIKNTFVCKNCLLNAVGLSAQRQGLSTSVVSNLELMFTDMTPG